MGFPHGSVVNNPLAMKETQVQSLSQEDPLEKEIATYFSILDRGAWWATVHGVTKSRTWLSDKTANVGYLLNNQRWTE